MPHSKDPNNKSQQASRSGNTNGSKRAEAKSPKPTAGHLPNKGRGKNEKGGRRSKVNKEANNSSDQKSMSGDMAGPREREWEPYHSLDGWNPMEEDFNSQVFNSYSKPSVEELAREFYGQDESRKSDAASGLQVYVTGIPARMTENGLTNLFSTAGVVRRVKLCKSRGNNVHAYGFVTMNSVKDVHRVISKLHGYRITDDSCLSVRISQVKPRRENQYGSSNFLPQRGYHHSGIDYPLEEVKQQGYYEVDEEGPYYDNIDSRGLYREVDDDREIVESSGGELKVHVRRSNSEDNEADGRRRRERGGGKGSRAGGSGGTHRSARKGGRSSVEEDNSEDSCEAEVQESGDGVSKSRSRAGKTPAPAGGGTDLGKLLASPEGQLMQQQLLSLAMAAFSPFRMNMQPSIASPSALINPTNLSVLSPQFQQQQQQQQQSATVEDITSPDITSTRKSSEKMTNGRGTSTQSSSSDDQKQPSKQSRDAAHKGHLKSSSPGEAQSEPKSYAPQQLKKKEKTSEVKLCMNCGEPGKKKCSVCQSPYCSAQCQRDHWPKHQHVCKKIKTSADAKATKDSSSLTPPKAAGKRYNGIEVSVKDLKKVKPSKKEMKVTVPYSESPTNFWVQLLLEENISGYIKMQEHMTKTFGDPDIEFLPVIPEVGHLYVCYSESSNEWYRFVVLEPPVGEMVHVQYADYGDEDDVPLKDIRLLNEGMIQLPLQGLNCTLKGISPTLGEWPKKVCEKFFELANGGTDKQLTVNFLQPKDGDKRAFVSKMIDDDGLDVIGQLVEAGFAKKEEKAKRKTEAKSPASVKPSVKPPSPLDKKAKAEVASPRREEAKAVQPSRHPGTPKIVLPPPVWKMLKEDDTVVITVSGIVSHGGKFYAYLDESSSAMMQQQEELQAFYHNSASEPNVSYQADDYLVGCYSVDECWYRARVMERTSSSLKVFFIDYGAEEDKHLSECRKMEPQFAVLAPQCITMSLCGVSDREGLPPLGEEFSRWVSGKPAFRAQIKQMSEEGVVSVILSALGDPRDCLNEKLKAKGYISVGDPGPAGDSEHPDPARGSGGDPRLRGPGSPVDQNSSTGAGDSTGRGSGEMKADECRKVFVMEVSSPVSFWACFAEDDPKMQTLEREMQPHYETPTGFRPKVGQQCVAQFCNVWYRALVTSKLESQDDCYKVFFVDYGNSSQVTSDQCRALLPEHDLLPPFCHHFKVENLADAEGPKHKEKFLEWLTTAEMQVMVRITKRGTKRNLVRIWRPDDEGDCFNDLIAGVRPRPPLPTQPFVGSVAVGDVVDMLLLDKQDDPYLFYGVSVTQAEVLTGLEEELRPECQRTDQKKYVPREGEVCLAKFQEDFYRAHVERVSGDEVQVLFVDYGNSARVGVSECRSLPEKFLSKPMVAHRCRLDSLSEMSTEDVDAFRNTDGRCSLQVTRKDGDVLVGIMWSHENPDKPINGVHQRALPEGANHASAGDGKGRPTVPKKEAQSETQGALPVEPSRTRDDEAVSSKTGPSTKRETPPRKSPLRRDKQEVKPKKQQNGGAEQSSQKSEKAARDCGSAPFIRASDIPKACLPRVGKLLPASLVFLETPSEMYFQPYVMETLKTLNAIVNDEASKKTIDSLKSYQPQVGELCMAYVVNQWCRAEVLTSSGSKFKLVVLDYGCTIDLGPEHLRPAQPSFVNYNLLCLKCSLFGVRPVGGKPWSTKAIDFTKQQLQGTETVVQLKVMEVVDGDLVVEIYLQTSEALSEVLITNALAQQKADRAGPVVALPYPLDNTELQVVVSGVINPRDFYCEITDKEGIDLVRYLMTAVGEYAEQQVPDPHYKPPVNTFCLGKFKVDDGWYRARILAVEGDLFKVQYIDFGNYDMVSSQELLPLPAQFEDISALAFPCALADVNKSASPALEAEWEGKVAQALVELTQNSVLKAKIVLTRNDISEVKLTVLESDEDVGEKLLEMFSNGSEKEEEEEMAPSPATAASPDVDPVVSELERLRAELASKNRENQELKKMLKK